MIVEQKISDGIAQERPPSQLEAQQTYYHHHSHPQGGVGKGLTGMEGAQQKSESQGDQGSRGRCGRPVGKVESITQRPPQGGEEAGDPERQL